MSNKKKQDLIRSLKPGDVVITGNHIGSIRYLGPLEGLANNHTLNNCKNKTNILELFAGIELTEPNGHMDGTMHINGKKIKYFTTTYGNNIQKKRNKQPKNNNNLENETKYDAQNDGKYGILIPAIAIQKKIDSFALLKKITILFDQYKSIKKQLNSYKNQQRTNDQPSLHNEQSLIDIKTNSDLISPPVTGYPARPNIPISQPSITSNNYSTTTIPGFNNNNNHHSNTSRYKKWSTTPLFNGYTTLHDNNNNIQDRDSQKMSLRKINSEPYPYRSQIAFVANAENNANNDINDGYLMHRHSNTLPHQHNNNNKLFVPNSNVTTPHLPDLNNIDDNSDFPSIEDQPKLDKHSKSYPNNLHKKQLNTSLPSPLRKLNRKHSCHTNKTYNNTQSRTRGTSFRSYTSQTASKRTPEPPQNPNDTLKISSTANKITQSPHVGPISPAISHTTVVINNEETTHEESENTHVQLEVKTQQKLCEFDEALSNVKTVKPPKEILVKIVGNELPKVATVLSPENSQKSDQTMNTQRSRAGTGHHPSASMYTHAPLNHWNDSNRYDKLTSVGGSADKNRDLSSLAITVSSPGHTRPKSAMNFNTRESMNVNNKIQHVANQDSVHLKQLLADLKKNKLNQINIAQEIEIIDNEIGNMNNINNIMNTETMRILEDNTTESSSSSSDSSNNDTNNDDLPRLVDNNTTAATAHSTADVLENLVTHSIASSPEEKLAEVENNEDEKQLLPIATDAMSDIATPIPKEAGANITDGDFDICDDKNPNVNTNNSEESIENVKKRLGLTVQSLRKHNKRRASREQLTFKEKIKDEINIGQRKNYVINIHHHQQTLSEPMLPKFALMMHTFDSSEEEKSASSDGEDTQSIGMENNLEDSVHTHDVTDDDVQLIQIPNNQNPNQNNIKIKQNQNENRLCSPTFTADSISRRSSVNLTSGVWDCSNITLYNLSGGVGDENETPKQQYIRRMAGPGTTSSTPIYSSYKTRHEYLRDMTYFNTLNRAQQIDQQFKKLKKEKNENKKQQDKLVRDSIEAAEAAVQQEKKRSNSISSLNIIQEIIFDEDPDKKEVNNTKAEEEDDDIEDIQDINGGHRQQLSCDTRAAIEGGIEPYKPSQHIVPQSAMV